MTNANDGVLVFGDLGPQAMSAADARDCATIASLMDLLQSAAATGNSAALNALSKKISEIEAKHPEWKR